MKISSLFRFLNSTRYAAIGTSIAAVLCVGPVWSGEPVANEKLPIEGLGGTGVSLANRGEHEGIGGTGIVGVITGFGSIYVNGIEVFVDEQTRIQQAGEAMTTSQLKVGQVVVISSTGQVNKDQLRADSVTVEPLLRGRVDHISANGAELEILGQKVSLDAPLEHLKEGDQAVVYGYRTDNSLTISLVEKEDIVPDGELKVAVTGPVSHQGGRTLVGGVAVKGWLDAPEDVQLTVSGVWNGQTLDVAESHIAATTLITSERKPQTLIVEVPATQVARDGKVRIGSIKLDVGKQPAPEVDKSSLLQLTISSKEKTRIDAMVAVDERRKQGKRERSPDAAYLKDFSVSKPKVEESKKYPRGSDGSGNNKSSSGNSSGSSGSGSSGSSGSSSHDSHDGDHHESGKSSSGSSGSSKGSSDSDDD